MSDTGLLTTGLIATGFGWVSTAAEVAAGVDLHGRRAIVTGGASGIGVNHLGHFALACGLHGALAASGDARVVSLSSTGHFRSPVVFDDLFYRFRAYDPMAAYGQSKTANVLFAVGAAERWAADGITVNAVMPGGIATALQRHMAPDYMEQARVRYGEGVLKSVEQGAATSVLCAVSPVLQGVSGRYFEDCNEAPVVASAAESDGLHGVAAYALDPSNADRLWDVSERLLTKA